MALCGAEAFQFVVCLRRSKVLVCCEFNTGDLLRLASVIENGERPRVLQPQGGDYANYLGTPCSRVFSPFPPLKVFLWVLGASLFISNVMA